jgi:hypothetical protein
MAQRRPGSFQTTSVQTRPLPIDRASARAVGFTAVTNNATDALPPSLNFFSSAPGVWKMNSTPTAKLVTDATAPCSPPRVWSTTYKAGMQAGRGPDQTLEPGQDRRPARVSALVHPGVHEARAEWHLREPRRGDEAVLHQPGGRPAIERCAVIPRAPKEMWSKRSSLTWTVWAGFVCGATPFGQFLSNRQRRSATQVGCVAGA